MVKPRSALEQYATDASYRITRRFFERRGNPATVQLDEPTFQGSICASYEAGYHAAMEDARSGVDLEKLTEIPSA